MRGERTDLNGPFLARSLLALGLEPARIHVVGDEPAELEAAVREAVGVGRSRRDSGGLGPTHDDRTVEVVAKVAGLGCASTRSWRRRSKASRAWSRSG